MTAYARAKAKSAQKAATGLGTLLGEALDSERAGPSHAALRRLKKMAGRIEGELRQLIADDDQERRINWVP